MPFNIELVKVSNGVSITLQVVKNIINIYYKGPETEALIALANWWSLDKYVLSTISSFNNKMVRGSDASHVKLHHTNNNEIFTVHSHHEFTSEITLELFNLYLTKLYVAQKEHGEAQYQFFVDSKEVQGIVKSFAIYIKHYKESANEELYEEETKLTEKEGYDYIQAIKENNLKSQGEPPKNPASLLISRVRSGRHPLFGETSDTSIVISQASNRKEEPSSLILNS